MTHNMLNVRQLCGRIIYSVTLLLISGVVFVQFLYPHRGLYAGINAYHRAKFMDMVEGRAYKPFVYRTLLPTTVRVLSAIVPAEYQKILEDHVVQNHALNQLFSALGWECQAALQYFMASVLMYLSLIGFGHSAVLLTQQTCNLPKDNKTRLIVATGSLLGVTFLFRYTSYIYDPPQLFLFTLALYLLSSDRIRLFFIVFVLCCLNKETAILLIPVFAIKHYRSGFDRRQYYSVIGSLIVIYLCVRAGVFLTFYNNPGSFVEFQFVHNVWWFTSGWKFTDVLFIGFLFFLIFFGWREKSYFLRVSFLSVLLPLVCLAMFLGYIDEWRGYYEAYALAFGLIVHSLLRVRETFRFNRKVVSNRYD